MLSTIIVSPTLEERTEKITQILLEFELSLNHPDLLIFNDEEKLGVEAVKKIKDFLSLKPYSAKGRGVIILSSQKLTLDAQNALLKILEEPPASAVILLGADSDKNFLPTILSRCQVVTHQLPVTENQSLKYYPEIEDLIKASLDERFAFVEKIEDKEIFIRALVSYFSHVISKDRDKSQNPQFLEFANQLIEAEKYLSAKGNPRAILEYLMLSLPNT